MGFKMQVMAPFLHWLTLGVLILMPVVIGFVLFKLGGMPGAIARARRHPQADAIAVCGWMGLITLVMWPVAMVWAHLPSENESVPESAIDPLLAKVRKISRSVDAIAKLSSGGT